MTTKQTLSANFLPQLDIFSDAVGQKRKIETKQQNTASGRRFFASNPEDIYFGNAPLKRHLEQANQHAPFIIAKLLNDQNWTDFESKYAASGRPPYAPRCMVGLILYGISRGVTSLRTLESLARIDLGCMWVSGGIFPDHANIGRFINRHQELLTGDFFEALACSVLKKTNSTGQCLAGDGTTIEAACSNYRLIKEEAVKTALEEATARAEKKPEDADRKAKLEKAVHVHRKLQEVKAHQKRRGAKTNNTRISPTEPDAVVQKMKRGRGYAPAYTPSILANEKRVVLAQAIDPTNESIVIPEMLDQASRTSGALPDELLLDGGYFNDSVIATTLEQDISLLCPEGSSPGQPRQSKKFQKGHFRYDETNDLYICPANHQLSLIYKPKDSAAPKAQWVYGAAPCDTCPLKSQCTTNKYGRRIRRFKEDKAKDALRLVMQHPAAKKVFRQRQAMVEPVFGYLRTKQGLNRFRRSGLKAVRLEFSLHLMAYNLSRAVAMYYHLIFALIWELGGGCQPRGRRSQPKVV